MISVFDIYKVGLGPSSSHTFGTMVASNMFVEYLKNNNLAEKTNEIDVHLYGSLALTGYGHGTCLSIELGLEGYTPDGITPQNVQIEKDRIYNEQTLNIPTKTGSKTISYKKDVNRFFHYDALEYHPNGLRFVAKDNENKILYENTYFSIGGGFVLTLDEIKNGKTSQVLKGKYEFSTFTELLEICKKNNKTIYDIVLENELCWRTQEEIDKQVQIIVDVMNDTIKNGLERTGKLQGQIGLNRRAPALLQKIIEREKKNGGFSTDFISAVDYVSMCGFAVAEENASFGRVITAPTNGACGVIPPVIKFIEKFIPEKYTLENIKKFILVSGVVGILCKKNATISGAEGGCQAEIGSACAMASAGYVACLGGTDKQIENGAIIGLVHNFGLTCDPVGGYVQVPCIERNPVNAWKAIQAGHIALREQQAQCVSLDIAIKTMKQVGDDMPCKYRETSQGGLAVNCPLS